MFRIFIGYDDREAAAYHTLVHSLLKHASQPLSITPLRRETLRRFHTRTKDPNASTDFAFTRFLVPFLSDYQGISIFMDCDMLCRVDICDVMLYVLANPEKAVHVCKHDYVPKTTSKFLNQPQTAYPRKNWSSFIVFNNEKCGALTPEVVDQETGLFLHRFQWLEDGQIGSLPLIWNWLVGEYDNNPVAHVLHYTLGTPCFKDYAACDHSNEWWDAFDEMTKPVMNLMDSVAVVRT